MHNVLYGCPALEYFHQFNLVQVCEHPSISNQNLSQK
jgi:hypothetical protein